MDLSQSQATPSQLAHSLVALIAYGPDAAPSGPNMSLPAPACRGSHQFLLVVLRLGRTGLIPQLAGIEHPVVLQP
jgi:hypothetical protein